MNDKASTLGTRSLDDRIGSLHFYAKRSQRYHQHRHGFYSGWLKRIQFLNLFLGSGAVSVYLFANSEDQGWSTTLLLLSPFIAAASSAWIVSFKVVDLAALHLSLYEAWNDFEQALRDLKSPDESDLANLSKRRLELEKREPPVYHAVNRMCRNEVIRSLGLPTEREQMHWRHWWFKDIYRFKQMLDDAR